MYPAEDKKYQNSLYVERCLTLEEKKRTVEKSAPTIDWFSHSVEAMIKKVPDIRAVYQLSLYKLLGTM